MLDKIGEFSLSNLFPQLHQAAENLQKHAAEAGAAKQKFQAEADALKQKADALKAVADIANATRGEINEALGRIDEALGATQDLLSDLSGALSGAGIHVYRYVGLAGQLGSQVNGALGGGLLGRGPTEGLFVLMVAFSDGGAAYNVLKLIGLADAQLDSLRDYMARTGKSLDEAVRDLHGGG